VLLARADARGSRVVTVAFAALQDEAVIRHNKECERCATATPLRRLVQGG